MNDGVRNAGLERVNFNPPLEEETRGRQEPQGRLKPQLAIGNGNAYLGENGGKYDDRHDV